MALCFLAFYPHVRHGGFYLDDWSNAAGSLQPPGGPGFGNALNYFADLTIYRPVLVVYVPLTYFAFGMHMAHHLIWAAFLALAVASLLYAVLRTLSVPWIHAWMISALVLVYPWFDSIRLWATASQVSLAVGLAFAGLWIALAGVSRRSWRWHAVATALYLLSILTYEVALPMIAAFGVLYLLRSDWGTARWRWLADLVVVIAGALWVGMHTARSTSGLSENLTHLKQIVEAGGTLLGTSLLPVSQQHTTSVLLVFAGILAIGVAAHRGFPSRFISRTGWGLGSWLSLVAGGLAVAALGWVMYIPADPYYTPSIYGMTNRVNGLAGIGLVVAAYGSFGIVGTLVCQLWSRTARAAVIVTVFLAMLLGVGYVDALRTHIGIWNSAFAAEKEGLSKLRAAVPAPPEDSTLFVSGYPAYQTLGVPIFAASWDLDGMVKMEYDDGTLWGYPVLPGLHLACRDGGIRLIGEGAPPRLAPYRTAFLVDLGTGDTSKPDGRSACEAVVGRYVPGPLYLSHSY